MAWWNLISSSSILHTMWILSIQKVDPRYTHYSVVRYLVATLVTRFPVMVLPMVSGIYGGLWTHPLWLRGDYCIIITKPPPPVTYECISSYALKLSFLGFHFISCHCLWSCMGPLAIFHYARQDPTLSTLSFQASCLQCSSLKLEWLISSLSLNLS